jgi:hypothetical protein
MKVVIISNQDYDVYNIISVLSEDKLDEYICEYQKYVCDILNKNSFSIKHNIKYNINDIVINIKFGEVAFLYNRPSYQVNNQKYPAAQEAMSFDYTILEIDKYKFI